MKRIVIAALLLGLAAGAEAKTQMLLSTATVPQGSITCLATDSGNNGRFNVDEQVSSAYSIYFSAGAYITVYSDAGSVATVAIETAETTAGPWYPVTGTTPVTNPSAMDAAGVGGETWWIPPDTNVRIHVTAYTSGAIRACVGSVNRASNTPIW